MLEAMFACHGTKTNGHLWRHTSKLAGDERKPPMWTHMQNTWLFGSWIPAAGRFKEFIEAFHSFRKWPKRNFYRVPLTKGQLCILCPQLDSYAKPERKMEETCETGLVAQLLKDVYHGQMNDVNTPCPVSLSVTSLCPPARLQHTIHVELSSHHNLTMEKSVLIK